MVVSQDGLVGIEDLQGNMMQVYPNPAKDVLYVECWQAAESMQWSLVNNLGQAVRKGVSNGGRQEINVRSLTEGMYVIRLEGKDNASEIKVLIE